MGGYNHKPNAALVIYTGAERRGEESISCRSSESNDTDLFLSRGNGGEDEFLSKEAVSYRIGTEVVVYCVYVRLKKLTNRNLQNYKERIHIMEGRLIAFVIWVIIGVLFIVMGIYDFNSKKAKPFGFWANAEVAPIEDVKGYNRALGILWCVYGVLFTLIGLPLLDGQNSGLIIIPILGAMLISIAAMVAYVVGIEPKYRKKK